MAIRQQTVNRIFYYELGVQIMKKFIVFFLVLFISSVVSAHERHENNQDVSIKTQKVAGAISMLQGRGGNIGASVGADGILIVDDDYAQVSLKLAEALKALGAEYPKFILNTHWHGDHTEGNKYFGKNSLIVAQENVRKRLAVESMVLGDKVPAYPDFALPEITYAQAMSIYFNGEEVRLVHYPNGHTDGDSVIFFVNSNVVHMGDHYFKDRFPFVDLDNGGSVEGMTRNIGDIINRLAPDAKIIPGHGALAAPADLKNYHQMLIETTVHVRNGMVAGKTLEGLKKEGLPEKYKSWGTGFIKTDAWIETIYKSFSMKSN